MQRIEQLRHHLSYANVVASLALFVALGGGAYAAINLPRNSVGAKQLRPHSVGRSELGNGAVTGRAVKSRSLGVSDLSRSARRSLRGSTGPAGPPGSPAAAYRAVISTGGDPVSGNASGVVHPAGTGDYVVRFPVDVSACTLIATLGNVRGVVTPPPAGRVTVTPEEGAVHVRTYDAAGGAAAASFHLVAAC
jgi:hypothetical protein